MDPTALPWRRTPKQKEENFTPFPRVSVKRCWTRPRKHMPRTNVLKRHFVAMCLTDSLTGRANQTATERGRHRLPRVPLSLTIGAVRAKPCGYCGGQRPSSFCCRSADALPIGSSSWPYVRSMYYIPTFFGSITNGILHSGSKWKTFCGFSGGG